MERQIPYILHLSDFFSSHKHLSYDLLMYYCICVIMLSKYIYMYTVDLPMFRCEVFSISNGG